MGHCIRGLGSYCYPDAFGFIGTLLTTAQSAWFLGRFLTSRTTALLAPEIWLRQAANVARLKPFLRRKEMLKSCERVSQSKGTGRKLQGNPLPFLPSPVLTSVCPANNLLCAGDLAGLLWDSGQLGGDVPASLHFSVGPLLMLLEFHAQI